MGFTDSYAYFMLVSIPLPIVSIKLGYNSRKEHSSDKRIHSKPVEEG